MFNPNEIRAHTDNYISAVHLFLVPDIEVENVSNLIRINQKINAIKHIRQYIHTRYPHSKGDNGYHIFGLRQAKDYVEALADSIQFKAKHEIDSTEYKINVMQAHLRGEAIERIGKFNDTDWVVATSPSWNWDEVIYRIKSTKPDSINWAHVDSRYNYMARDENGFVWIYDSEPTKRTTDWGNTRIAKNITGVFSSYEAGEVSWDNSLVKRPE